jgi:hypothetical protein
LKALQSSRLGLAAEKTEFSLLYSLPNCRGAAAAGSADSSLPEKADTGAKVIVDVAVGSRHIAAVAAVAAAAAT